MISIKKYDYFSKLSNAYAEKTLGSPKGPILWPLDSNLLMCDYISMIDSDCCHIMYRLRWGFLTKDGTLKDFRQLSPSYANRKKKTFAYSSSDHLVNSKNR